MIPADGDPCPRDRHHIDRTCDTRTPTVCTRYSSTTLPCVRGGACVDRNVAGMCHSAKVLKLGQMRMKGSPVDRANALRVRSPVSCRPLPRLNAADVQLSKRATKDFVRWCRPLRVPGSNSPKTVSDKCCPSRCVKNRPT